jgi:hypothetical protein
VRREGRGHRGDALAVFGFGWSDNKPHR